MPVLDLAPTLTDREVATVEFIRSCRDTRGYPPSVREIGKAVGLRSPSSVHSLLRRLEKVQVIKRVERNPRAITLIDTEEAA